MVIGHMRLAVHCLMSPAITSKNKEGRKKTRSKHRVTLDCSHHQPYAGGGYIDNRKLLACNSVLMFMLLMQ